MLVSNECSLSQKASEGFTLRLVERLSSGKEALVNQLLPAGCCGLCDFGAPSRMSSLNETDFSKDTDLSENYKVGVYNHNLSCPDETMTSNHARHNTRTNKQITAKKRSTKNIELSHYIMNVPPEFGQRMWAWLGTSTLHKVFKVRFNTQSDSN